MSLIGEMADRCSEDMASWYSGSQVSDMEDTTDSWSESSCHEEWDTIEEPAIETQIDIPEEPLPDLSILKRMPQEIKDMIFERVVREDEDEERDPEYQAMPNILYLTATTKGYEAARWYQFPDIYNVQNQELHRDVKMSLLREFEIELVINGLSESDVDGLHTTMLQLVQESHSRLQPVRLHDYGNTTEGSLKTVVLWLMFFYIYAPYLDGDHFKGLGDAYPCEEEVLPAVVFRELVLLGGRLRSDEGLLTPELAGNEMVALLGRQIQGLTKSLQEQVANRPDELKNTLSDLWRDNWQVRATS